jgi:hypothetical protein
MMQKVFISYSREDINFVERLAEDLKSRTEVWLDKWEIEVGDSIPEKINDGIRDSSYVAVILSSNSVNKDWFKRELYAFVHQHLGQNKKRILPVQIDDCDVPALISDLYRADFREDYDSGLRQILKVISLKEEVTADIPNMSDERVRLKLSALRDIAKRTIEEKRRETTANRPFDFGDFQKDDEIGPSKQGTSGLARHYLNGLVVWHDYGKYASKAFAIYGAIGYRFQKLGNDRWVKLGFPIADEQDASPSPYGSTGRYHLFEDGIILWYSNSSYREQTLAIWGAIAKKYISLGASASQLGFPVSEPYLAAGGMRCDFEGGSIISLNSDRTAHMVRQLLRIDYSDSPLNHNWYQHTGLHDSDCVGVRLGTSIGNAKSYIAFSLPWDKRSIRYPTAGFQPDEVRERFCGITLKSLIPGAWIRLYVKVKTNAPIAQFLEFDSETPQKELLQDKVDNVEYWKVPLPTQCNDGEWHTLIIDLENEIQEGFLRSFEWIHRFHFRGHIGVGDLVVSNSHEAIEQVTLNPVRIW